MSKLRGALVGALSLAAVNSAYSYISEGTDANRAEGEQYLESKGYSPEQAVVNYETVREINTAFMGAVGLVHGGIMGAVIGGILGRRRKDPVTELLYMASEHNSPSQD